MRVRTSSYKVCDFCLFHVHQKGNIAPNQIQVAEIFLYVKLNPRKKSKFSHIFHAFWVIRRQNNQAM